MTLVEILIAMGILAIGMVGICSLFPLSIRNISTAVNRTVATSVGHSVRTSMGMNCLDLSRLPATDYYAWNAAVQQNYRDANLAKVKKTNTPTYNELDGSDTPGLICNAICDFDTGVSARGCGGRAAGVVVPYDCDTDQSFQIPADVVLAADLIGGVSPLQYVVYGADPTYGWTATLYPVDGKLDGAYAPPPGDPPADATTEKMVVQVAVWRSCRLMTGLKTGGGAVNGDFTNDPVGGKYVGLLTNLDVVATDPFWTKVRKGDYVRHKDYGIWYEIADMDTVSSPAKIHLTQEFTHPSFDEAPPTPPSRELTGEVEVASRFRLIALYRFVIPN